MNTEHRIQCAIVTEARWRARQYPELDTLMAIPNGGMRSKGTAGKLKAEGVKAGAWDLFLPAPTWYETHWYHGLWVEVKAPGGSLTPAQQRFGREMVEAGYCCYVPRHTKHRAERDIIEDTVGAMVDYLSGKLGNGRCWRG